MYQGNKEIKKIYLGDKEVKKIYQGDKLIYTSVVSYSITPTLTNVSASASNPSFIVSGGTATLIFTANEGYNLPDSVSVVGATSQWTKATGTLVLSNPTGDVSFSISGTPSFVGTIFTYGSNRKIGYSNDGNSWNIADVLTQRALNDVAYHNGLFIGVASYGYAYTSTDGINWSSGVRVSTESLLRIAYGNGRFVCVGLSGATYSTTDGITWTQLSGASGDLRDIVYGNGRFVTVGSSGNSFQLLDNSNNWSILSGLTSSRTYYNIHYYNNVFITTTNISSECKYLTNNNNTWASITTQILTGCLSSNDEFAISLLKEYGSNIFSKSYDGITWDSYSGIGNVTSCRDVCFANDRFVTVGSSGESHYSLDGNTWVIMSGLDASTSYGVVIHVNI